MRNKRGNGHIDDSIVSRRCPYMKMVLMFNESKVINLIKKTSGSLLNKTNPPAMKEEVLEVKS